MKKLAIVLCCITLAITAFSQKHKLELTLRKGETYHQRMNSKSVIVQNLNGQELKIDMTIIGNLSYQVKSSDATSYTMDVMYESIGMKMAMPGGGEMDFSSESTKEGDVFSGILSTMKNKTFTVVMLKNGKVKEVQNIQLLFDDMFSKANELPEAQKQQFKTQITQAFGDKAFKSSIEAATAIFPDKPVAKGDSWTVENTIESGMKITTTTTYELSDVIGDEVTIYGSSVVETKDKDAVFPVNGMSIKYNMKGSGKGTLSIHKSTGWIITSSIDQSIEGNAFIVENPQLPDGLDIPMSISSKTIITDK